MVNAIIFSHLQIRYKAFNFTNLPTAQTSETFINERGSLTEVCDPDGHFLVEVVENHDDDEADDGGCDGRGHLRGDILFEWLQLLSIHQIISQLHRENYEHRQTVHDHADHRRYDQQNLQQKHQTDRHFKGAKNKRINSSSTALRHWRAMRRHCTPLELNQRLRSFLVLTDIYLDTSL